MKIVILGSNGQLGQKLKNDLNGKFNLFTFNKKELDITNLNKVSVAKRKKGLNISH